MLDSATAVGACAVGAALAVDFGSSAMHGVGGATASTGICSGSNSALTVGRGASTSSSSAASANMACSTKSTAESRSNSRCSSSATAVQVAVMTATAPPSALVKMASSLIT